MTAFTFIPATDPQLEDDEYQLVADPRISVQVSREGRKTYYYAYFTGEDAEGTYIEDHGEFTSLERAQAKALEVATQIAA